MSFASAPRLVLLVVLLGAGTSAVACEAEEEGGISPRVGAEPKTHRAASETCPGTPNFRGPMGNSGRGGAPSGAKLECAADADCTAGANGKCVAPCFSNGHTNCTAADGASRVCSYDECTDDTACSGKGPCLCGAKTGGRDACASGLCAVDADCGPGGFCSPSESFGLCPTIRGASGYFCHTPKDECIDEADCAKPDFGGSSCVYSSDENRWRCTVSTCVG